MKNSLFLKLIIIGALIVITWVPTMMVLALVMDRANRSDEAAAEIGTSWSREQTLAGPYLAIPVRTPAANTNEKLVQDEIVYLLPESLAYTVDMDTDTLSRGIYDAGVYTSAVTGQGTFDLGGLALPAGSVVDWSKARLSLALPDTRGVEPGAALTWNGKAIGFEPGVAGNAFGSSGISVPVAVTQFQKQNTFSFSFSVRGSQGLNFTPLGKSTDVSITSDWLAPSFTGEFLPKERELSAEGFTASWSVASFGRSLEQSWVAGKYDMRMGMEKNGNANVFGVALYDEVSFYTLVTRAVKYSILFITLTFLAFFMFEVLAKLRIHPVNYLLVGLGVAMFYLLLLSFSETVGFLAAYAGSTLAVTGLITAYSLSVLKARTRAFGIGGMLLALYGYLYVLLQLDELALVFGSVFLFIVLGAVMYLTRNIDWYEVGEAK